MTMMSCDGISGKLRSEFVQAELKRLYGNRNGMTAFQTGRYEKLIQRYTELFGENGPLKLVSAPGRTEIGGNHTDHNRGRVLAASVNLDTVAAVAPRDDMLVRLMSEGYPEVTVDLADLAVREAEYGTTASLIRGVAAGMLEHGRKIGGFNAAVTSTVAAGSGLSSSAAFEVMLTGIYDALFNDGGMPFAERAVIGKYAENVYFGKPSGLLDQMASAAGGLVTVDFGTEPAGIRAMDYDFAAAGYALVVVGTGGSHADLTEYYASIPAEMKAVAARLGGGDLHDVDEVSFTAHLGTLREELGDRPLMRAMHFYDENRRVLAQVAALDAGDMNAFLKEINASGRSSFMYLQNVWARPEEQGLSLALCLAERILGARGAWRVHGGGFAGTTLNFVPADLLDEFTGTMEKAFGAGCCNVLDIRPQGVYVLDIE